MSYCRWSSNNFDSDLYCYEDVRGGYTTHIASNRVVGKIPKVPEFPPRTASAEEVKAWSEAYVAAHKIQMAFLDKAERVPIGLTHDGDTFNDSDLPSFLARVLVLKEMGYHVPPGLTESIEEEIADGGARTRTPG